MSEEMMEETTTTASEATHPTLEGLGPKTKVTGTVTQLELYGAFIDIGVGVNALIHISKLGSEHVNRVSDVLKVGDEVTVWVEKVDSARQQVMVTMIEPLAVDWRDLKDGQTYTGKVSRLESYGAFIDIGAEREGLVHISELSYDYVKHPSEVVQVGDEVQVQVLSYSKRKRRIDLSIKALLQKPEAEKPFARVEEIEDAGDELDEEQMEMVTNMEFALRKALGQNVNTRPGRSKQKDNKKKYRDERQRREQERLLDRTLQSQID